MVNLRRNKSYVGNGINLLSPRAISGCDSRRCFASEDCFTHHHQCANHPSPSKHNSEDYLCCSCSLRVGEMLLILIITAVVAYASQRLPELCTIGCITMLSTGCFLLSWMVIYFDSVQPGLHPPQPLSTINLKKPFSSFHMGYIMCFLNGAAMFLSMLWLVMNPLALMDIPSM